GDDEEKRAVILVFVKQKTAYEMLPCWSSDVCSSDLFQSGDRARQIERLVGDEWIGRLQIERPRARVLEPRARETDADVVRESNRSEERRVGKEGRNMWSQCTERNEVQ